MGGNGVLPPSVSPTFIQSLRHLWKPLDRREPRSFPALFKHPGAPQAQDGWPGERRRCPSRARAQKRLHVRSAHSVRGCEGSRPFYAGDRQVACPKEFPHSSFQNSLSESGEGVCVCGSRPSPTTFRTPSLLQPESRPFFPWRASCLHLLVSIQPR